MNAIQRDLVQDLRILPDCGPANIRLETEIFFHKKGAGGEGEMGRAVHGKGRVWGKEEVRR